MESTWAKTELLIVKKTIRIFLESSAPTVSGSSRAKSCKLVKIITFIRRAHVVQSVEIHLVTAKKCSYKVLPFGILVVVPDRMSRLSTSMDPEYTTFIIIKTLIGIQPSRNS